LADLISIFGGYLCRIAPRRPGRARALLTAAYRANGVAIRVAPNRKLPPARRYAVNHINDAVVRMLSHPDRAALVSVFMPCELLTAMDVIPMCAEMYSSYINGTKCERIFAEAAENAGISETYCSYHKILLGSAYAGVLPPPKMVVNCSLVCDANNLTFRELARFYGVPQFYVDVPAEQSEASVAYVSEQFRGLAAFLEEHTGRPLDEARLREAVARSRDTIRALRGCLREKRAHSLPGNVVGELNEVYMVHNALGTSEALRYANGMLEALRRVPKTRGIRLLWLHTLPIWQAPVKELFDFSERCEIVACDMNLEGLVEMDPDRPYESMARRLVFSTWNGGAARVRACVEAAQALQTDGVVCFCHWGCKQTTGLSAVLKSELEQAGFPTLILNGDGCDRRNASDGQIATRLNAFLEMLENRHG